jgi:glycosyltransferase involved in cell wall biosynthesis
MGKPALSIIIAVKNAGPQLGATLSSIRAQHYPLEVIVIDGASTDDTHAILKNNQDIITHAISEPDQGIADAFNKGLRIATGEYINFQGAGDTLYAPDCLSQLFEKVDSSYQLVCGKVVRVQEDGITPIWIAPKMIKPFKRCSLLFKMSLPHQGLFTHRAFFKQHGEFDVNTQFAMDYELLLRAYHRFPKTLLKDVIVSRWRVGGVGSNRIKEIFDEYDRIKKQHHVASRKVLWAIDQFTRAKYQIKMRLRVPY